MSIDYGSRRITWRRGHDPVRAAYEADVDGAHLVLSVGDFPAEPLYALMVDGQRVATYDAWPATWTRPT